MQCITGRGVWEHLFVTAQPHAHVRFRRAIERRALWPAEDAALLVREVSDVQSIDRTWMITMRSGIGPFGMMDRMGLSVVHHVAKLLGETGPNTQALESARYLDERFIQKGFLGVVSGHGFYRYPNPAFDQPGFI